ncbi:ABC transporter transmembrane region [Rhizoctonia solani]|uniref:ABC transporter transmembrane region n=1 Tax=Rhizoctonia solani TaxID=456999 RepID=A0A8H7IBJ2_9AGAM|nr:ABC transporter transmembrane region [Rhizoctonia solani]
MPLQVATPGILDSTPSLGITPALHFGLTVFRVLILAVLFTTLFFPRVTYEPIEQNESVPRTDETPLLIPAAVAASTQSSAEPGSSKPKYGTFNDSNTTPPGGVSTSAPGTSVQAPTIPVPTEPTWYENGARLMRLTSYLWPSRNIGLQLLAFICLLIVAVGRIVNAAIPFQFSTVVDTLAQPDAPHGIWGPLLWYIVLRFLSSSGGLNALRSVLWAPVIQFSDRSLSQLAFDHLLNLSLAWHTRRKTGEVLRILDRGASIKQIFELLIFTLLPTAADTFIAVWIFFWYFGPAMSVFIATTMVLYVTTSAMITNRINNLSRRMVETDITTRGVHTDSLLNYETVKYFNGEAHEGERYHEALSRVQQFQLRVTASLNLMSLSQNLVLTAGLLVGSLLIIFNSTHQDVMKRFVVFITYLAELYSPLTAFALLYRTISQSLVDAERLLDLLDEPSEVRDKPSAKDLVVTDGVIEFGRLDNVTFSYDGRATALKGVSFKVPKGGSLALVGDDGAIRIDGQDIRDVTQSSKGDRHLPQDCVLFNNTIAYNIGYGKLGSSTEEIENAARAAQIHERIISFPDGYETIVGERGVRLSGGEKQRVGIARTILKASPVILLDEATSALDTSTERDIQKALQNLTEGRSLHIVSSEKLVPTGVASKHPEPIKPKRQEPSSDSTHEVRPDVTFAAVVSSEPTASQLISNSQTDN